MALLQIYTIHTVTEHKPLWHVKLFMSLMSHFKQAIFLQVYQRGVQPFRDFFALVEFLAYKY